MTKDKFTKAADAVAQLEAVGYTVEVTRRTFRVIFMGRYVARSPNYGGCMSTSQVDYLLELSKARTRANAK